MIPKEVNLKLVEAIKKCISSEEVLANFLINQLNIGKETAYRRIKGENQFTLWEAVTLAKKLKISLDDLFEFEQTNTATFILNMSANDNYIRFYEDNVNYFLGLDPLLETYDGTKLTQAFNMIPSMFLIKYNALAKFDILRWQYRFSSQKNYDLRFDKFTIPDDLREKQLHFVCNSKKVEITETVLGQEVFTDIVDDIRYFHDMGMICADNVGELKAELRLVIQDMKQIALLGRYDNGQKVKLYISNIKFDTTYSCFESPAMDLSFISIRYINSVATMDSFVNKTLMHWLQSLKASSTLISGSGEIHCQNFFAKQLELINTL